MFLLASSLASARFTEQFSYFACISAAAVRLETPIARASEVVETSMVLSMSKYFEKFLTRQYFVIW